MGDGEQMDPAQHITVKLSVTSSGPTYAKKEHANGCMQDLWDPIKRPNLWIMGIEEVEEIQAKSIENIFNKIIAENFPNLKKERVIQV
jgi:hypothetical protein